MAIPVIHVKIRYETHADVSYPKVKPYQGTSVTATPVVMINIEVDVQFIGAFSFCVDLLIDNSLGLNDHSTQCSDGVVNVRDMIPELVR